jgi:hypothetical protein
MTVPLPINSLEQIQHQSSAGIILFLENFLCTQLCYHRAAYMKTTKQIPEETILWSKQKTLTDKCH